MTMPSPTNDNLQKLAELTEKLPVFADNFVKMTDSSSYFNASHGTILGWKLLNQFGFAVHKWFISKDTEMGLHSHNNSIETIIVAKGCMNVTVDCVDCVQKNNILMPGDSIKILPNVKHNAFCTEDTWAITITIPPAEGFPE